MFGWLQRFDLHYLHSLLRLHHCMATPTQCCIVCLAEHSLSWSEPSITSSIDYTLHAATVYSCMRYRGPPKVCICYVAPLVMSGSGSLKEQDHHNCAHRFLNNVQACNCSECSFDFSSYVDSWLYSALRMHESALLMPSTQIPRQEYIRNRYV